MPFVDANGTRIFYRFDGRDDMPVLLLSNSLGTNLGMWEPQVAAFAERTTRIRSRTARAVHVLVGLVGGALAGSLATAFNTSSTFCTCASMLMLPACVVRS